MKTFDQVLEDVQKHLLPEWSACAAFNISFSAGKAGATFISVHRNGTNLDGLLKAEPSLEKRKQLRRDWYWNTVEQAKGICLALIKAGFKAKRDCSMIIVIP